MPKCACDFGMIVAISDRLHQKIVAFDWEYNKYVNRSM